MPRYHPCSHDTHLVSESDTRREVQTGGESRDGPEPTQGPSSEWGEPLRGWGQDRGTQGGRDKAGCSGRRWAVTLFVRCPPGRALITARPSGSQERPRLGGKEWFWSERDWVEPWPRPWVCSGLKGGRCGLRRSWCELSL